MDFVEFTAGIDDNDRRLDKIIRKFCSELTLSSVYKYIRKGLIKVNNKKTSAEYHVLENDKIQIADFILNASKNQDTKEAAVQKQKNYPEINVIFRNNDLLIINKPYNFTVHGSQNDKNSLEKMIKELFPAKNHNSLSFEPGPLHRLDKKTTGLLVFSQSLEGARIFSEQLRNHQIQKKYFGIAQGILQKKEIWVDEISKENTRENDAFHNVLIEKNEKSKTAQTEATPLFYGKYKNLPVTVIQYYIKTGRTHQIRSQTSFHGYPLLGDTAYGGKKLENESRDFYLHAAKLIFLNPEKLSDLPGEVECYPDQDFISFITKTCGRKLLEL